MENPAFCFTQTEEFHHRCSNFVIGQAGNDDFWSDLQKKKKKKKRSIPVWMQELCSFRPESDTKCAAKQVLTFFFFGDHPCFLFFKTSSIPSTIKSASEFERPDFVIKIVE